MRDELPDRLHKHLQKTLYYEKRKEGVIKFFDVSQTKFGQQAVGNRVQDVFNEISHKFNLDESNDQIRRILKKALGFRTTKSADVRPKTLTKWQKSEIRIGNRTNDDDDYLRNDDERAR